MAGQSWFAPDRDPYVEIPKLRRSSLLQETQSEKLYFRLREAFAPEALEVEVCHANRERGP
jgi:hypothetical protein